MHKYEIVSALGRRFGYRAYLEICTPTTGRTFSRVDANQFPWQARAMYRCPRDFSDGEPIHLATDGLSSEVLFHKIVRSGRRFDLVFVDPWHDHASSLRDIVYALHVAGKAGAVVVHDCSPPDAACAAPAFRPGDWCGVTYAAYLDVVLSAAGIRHVTVDSDFGCGIIGADPRLAALTGEADASLAAQWRAQAPGQKYAFFDANRSRLLNLVTAAEFLRRLAADT